MPGDDLEPLTTDPNDRQLQAMLPAGMPIQSLRIPDSFLRDIDPVDAEALRLTLVDLFERVGCGYRIWYDVCMCETVVEPVWPKELPRE